MIKILIIISLTGGYIKGYLAQKTKTIDIEKIIEYQEKLAEKDKIIMNLEMENKELKKEIEKLKEEIKILKDKANTNTLYGFLYGIIFTSSIFGLIATLAQ